MTVRPLCVDVPAAAQMLGVSQRTVRALIADGRLPAVKLPPTRGPERVNRRVLIAVAT